MHLPQPVQAIELKLLRFPDIFAHISVPESAIDSSKSASSPPATLSNPGYWHASICFTFSNPGLSIRRKHEHVGQIVAQAPHETQVAEYFFQISSPASFTSLPVVL